MAHGGARPGAGRKPGTKGKTGPKPKTLLRRAIAEKILKDQDLTPLEVMVEAMRDAYMVGDTKNATAYAAMAAPYIHPRLSSVNANHNGEVKAVVQIVSEFPDA